FDMGEVTSSMFEVLGDARATLASVVKPSKDPMLSVGPGRLALAKLETALAGQFDAPYRLKDALAPIVKDYDYIILDTPPSLGILTVNALGFDASACADPGSVLCDRGHGRFAGDL